MYEIIGNSTENSGDCHELTGQTAMNEAVTRLQGMLAESIAAEHQKAKAARSERLSRYICLLGNPLGLANQDITDEFSELAQEFYLPRNVDEESRIIMAGGITYGF